MALRTLPPATVGAPLPKRSGVRNPARWAHVPLGLTALLLLFPFYWTVVMATNTNSDFYRTPPKVVPGGHLLENIASVLTSINFFGSMANTFIVATSVTLLVLFFDSLAAFAFAKYDFPGKKFLFGLMLAFFMLPAQLSTVPQFITMINLGWVGTLQALIVPAAANAFGIFWMRQYISGAVPDEILDAAVVDGCGFFRQYRLIVLPVIRPGLAFLGIYTFVAAWNDYVWPLIVLVNPDMLTLQVALSQLNVSRGTDYAVVMAGALLAIVPLVVVFLLFARQFVADSVKGAVR
ncbi:cellobiose transport system permease protein [Kineococcus radiotolerans]|uniref:Cellobiose transport system permease protein n=1 Tax=Kineococcus radiotolerans TaxID=131568 RepID=A0A7W4TMQ7_KINRA|nr:carbohydrate ABC transporter permease [Kineococcus radiotolerans]MBB2901106.1 cellobiose transport system permease protein [Kineococcus radiotolerans]